MRLEKNMYDLRLHKKYKGAKDRVYSCSQSIIVLALFLLLTGCKCNNVPDYSNTIAHGRSYALELLEETGASAISVAFMANGEIMWAEGFGLADKESSVVTDTDTIFGIGSASKIIATVAVMILADRGLVDIDKPVTEYIPGFYMQSPEYSEITVKMLLNHSSGFPGTEYKGSLTRFPDSSYLEEVMETLKNSRLQHNPGEMNIYCNDGFTLIEKIVANVTGNSYASFIADEIFYPLGMNQTLIPSVVLPEGSYAKGYNPGEEKSKPFEFINTLGSGGVYSTPMDLCRFLTVFATEGSADGVSLLSRNAVEQMSIDQTVGRYRPVDRKGFRFGLGWDTVCQPGIGLAGYQAWAKGGDTYQYGSSVIVIPEAGLAAAVTGASGLNSVAAEALAEIILLYALLDRGDITAMPEPLPDLPETKAPIPGQLKEAISGFYANSNALFNIELKKDDAVLISEFFDGKWLTLVDNLYYRENGCFSNDIYPNHEYYFIEENGLFYLVYRGESFSRLYQDDDILAQQISSTGILPEGWEPRIGSRWVLVNEPIDSLPMYSIFPPLITLWKIGETVFASGHSFTLPVLPDNETHAYMFLKIPTLSGRDQNDLGVLTVDGEEWLLIGSYLYRPIGSLYELVCGSSFEVTIQPRGFGEWILLDQTTGGLLNVDAPEGSRFILVDKNFEILLDSYFDVADVYDAPAESYLLLMGDSGDTFSLVLK